MLEPALRAACATASVLALGFPLRAQDPAAEVRAAFEAGRLDRALELTEELADRSLAAEWRFHVLHRGGDLPGALAAVRAAEETFPANPRLLENGARCALALGLGDVAHEQVRRLLALPLEGDARERVQELEAQALELVAREREALAGVARARAVTLALALAAGAALWTLARAGRVASEGRSGAGAPLR